MKCGCEGQMICMMLTDTQIVNETFLEDVNNVLNTGEITNLYEDDDLKTIYEQIEDHVVKLGRSTAREVMYSTYVERVRDNFGIFLCMSPVGDALRVRCRKFPSLVNCCTLDWYDSWNESALLSVS